MKPTILIYDSGMGGLTIYDEIRKVLPNANYLYCFDNELFPYSEKPEEILVDRAVQIVQKITQITPLDLIVVACNTASTIVLPALRKHFDIEVVGTVPAIKPAALLSETKTIGLLATKGTIKRAYVEDLADQYAQNCNIEKIGSTDLVRLVEEKQQTDFVDMARLQKIVAKWQNHPTLDTVILGCTHFPAVKEELQELLPNVKYFVDSGEAIAKRVLSLLKGKTLSNNQDIQNVAYCTLKTENFSHREKVMKKWGFKRLDLLQIP